ncbi:hypothetical protein BOTBODRAFT_38907 [Botryobasidium botryosum FD-172 SS1]|uniref:F-box domain-containing protein n=1 Tax=Botryobasidium botryosum (strain FD-172 SS1) TaxID=930990 RepID=A0A067LY59_BOTB1|nr:hypothetical protein BOTBODRAFT_38907 [Botryobasidium botryosum FD-172 SS1]
MNPQFFTAILSPSIPRLVQSLCQKVHEFEVAYGETDSIDISKIFDQKSVTPFRFHVPKTDKSDTINPVDAIDEECGLLENARFLANEAIRLCTAHMISILRTRRNQYNSTYRLPNEVLSLIFQFTERSSGNPLRPLRQRTPLNVAAVSRLWREVALNTPSLWTRIDVMAPGLTRIFLDRSKEAPLHLEVDADKLDTGSWSFVSWAYIQALGETEDSDEESDEETGEEDEDGDTHEDSSEEEDVGGGEGSYYSRAAPVSSPFSRLVKVLRTASHRWASLQLQEASAAEVVQTLCFPLPFLESLRMTRRDASLPYDLGTGTSTAYELSTGAVLRANAPRLRDLHLTAVPISLASPMYAGLTNLRLENIRHTASIVRQLLSVIAACPELESLILIKVYFRDRDLAENSAPSIPMALNRLQRLQLDHVDAHLPKAILDSFSIPSSVIMELGMVISSWGEAVMPTNVVNAPLIRRMFISTDRGSSDISACAIIGRASEEGPVILEIRYIRSHISLEFIGCYTPDILRHLGQINTFSSLELLTFSQWDDKDRSNPSTFAEMLASFPGLKVLALEWCPSTYLYALVVSPYVHLCPRLQTLRLRRTDFDETLLKLVESRAARRDRGRLGSLELAGYFDKYPCVSIIAALRGLVAVSEDPVPQGDDT